MPSNDLHCSGRGGENGWANRPPLNPGARPADMARLLMGQYALPASTAIDATMGNGHDTLELLRLVGSGGKVYGFDIQEEAILATGNRLLESGFCETERDTPANERRFEKNVKGPAARLIRDNHCRMRQYVREPISVAVFNLGYLPGGDKEVTTTASHSCGAVKEALSMLRPGGAVILTIYWGHPAGREEREALHKLAEELPGEQYHSMLSQLVNQGQGVPEVLTIVKKRAKEKNRK